MKLDAYFSKEEGFNKNEFLPKSNYAQAFTIAKMYPKLDKDNLFFKTVPAELYSKIAHLTVPASFSEQADEVFDIYAAINLT